MTTTRTGSRFTETEAEYVVELELPEDADTAHLEEKIEDGTLEIHAPRRRPLGRPAGEWNDRRYHNPDATPC